MYLWVQIVIYYFCSTQFHQLSSALLVEKHNGIAFREHVHIL